MEVTMSLLETRRLYERHIDRMPDDMPYVDALTKLVAMFGAARLAEIAKHRKDEDCTVDRDGNCLICNVHHGDPCPVCGGRAYHKPGCERSDAH